MKTFTVNEEGVGPKNRPLTLRSIPRIGRIPIFSHRSSPLPSSPDLSWPRKPFITPTCRLEAKRRRKPCAPRSETRSSTQSKSNQIKPNQTTPPPSPHPSPAIRHFVCVPKWRKTLAGIQGIKVNQSKTRYFLYPRGAGVALVENSLEQTQLSKLQVNPSKSK